MLKITSVCAGCGHELVTRGMTLRDGMTLRMTLDPCDTCGKINSLRPNEFGSKLGHEQPLVIKYTTKDGSERYFDCTYSGIDLDVGTDGLMFIFDTNDEHVRSLIVPNIISVYSALDNKLYTVLHD